MLHHNIFEERCWINCMSLDILDQTDPVDCKLRAQEGVRRAANRARECQEANPGPS